MPKCFPKARTLVTGKKSIYIKQLKQYNCNTKILYQSAKNYYNWIIINLFMHFDNNENTRVLSTILFLLLDLRKLVRECYFWTIIENLSSVNYMNVIFFFFKIIGYFLAAGAHEFNIMLQHINKFIAEFFFLILRTVIIIVFQQREFQSVLSAQNPSGMWNAHAQNSVSYLLSVLWKKYWLVPKINSI